MATADAFFRGPVESVEDNILHSHCFEAIAEHRSTEPIPITWTCATRSTPIPALSLGPNTHLTDRLGRNPARSCQHLLTAKCTKRLRKGGGHFRRSVASMTQRVRTRSNSPSLPLPLPIAVVFRHQTVVNSTALNTQIQKEMFAAETVVQQQQQQHRLCSVVDGQLAILLKLWYRHTETKFLISANFLTRLFSRLHCSTSTL